VQLVDDDPAVLEAVGRLLRSAGHLCRPHADAHAFLESYDPSVLGCIVLDLDLPNLDGFAVQSAVEGGHPVIFLTGTGDIPSSVRALKSGAVDFLTKPCSAGTLVAAVEEALAADAAMRAERDRSMQARELLPRLTPREREVLERVISGRLNKQIAAELGTSEKTIKVHRFRVMRKLGAKCVPDLIATVNRAGGQE
jgi:FixJ family two-component response regulator